LIEGRALGREKGYEMFEELGFYEGFALTWKRIHENSGKSEDRAMHHIGHLLNLVAQFPRFNPSSVANSSDDLDIPKLFRQIRSRYKALCATLGVRPSLRAADEQVEDEAAPEQVRDDGSVPVDKKSKKVWSVDGIGKRSASEDLSF